MLSAALALLLLLSQSDEPGARFDALWNAGRRVEAIEGLASALEAGSASAERLRLARAQFEVHWYDAALGTLEPLGSEVDGLRALALYKLGRFEQALARLPEESPEHVLLRVEALEALGRPEQAARALARAESVLGADDPRLLGYRGRELARQGDHGAAAAAFEQALTLDPLDAGALFGLGRARVALGERELGLQLLERHRDLAPKLDQLDFARRSLDLAPLNPGNHGALGDAERALGRSAQARSAYERGLELADASTCVPIGLRLARLLSEDLGEVDAAVGVLESVGARSRDPRPWVRAGDVLMKAGRRLEAVQRYFQARDLRPGDAVIEARIQAARSGDTRGDGD